MPKNRPNWVVIKVKPLDDYKIRLTFITGEEKTYDMSQHLDEKPFQLLADPEFFKQVHVVGPSIAWSDNIDIAPETLYENSTPVLA